MQHESRISGFHRLSIDERSSALARRVGLAEGEIARRLAGGGLDPATADKIVENVIGVYALPLGVGLNFRVDGVDRLAPMAVEEPSVIAAASHAARMVRAAGGFHAEQLGRSMTAQVQLYDVRDPESPPSASCSRATRCSRCAASGCPAWSRAEAGRRSSGCARSARGTWSSTSPSIVWTRWERTSSTASRKRWGRRWRAWPRASSACVSSPTCATGAGCGCAVGLVQKTSPVTPRLWVTATRAAARLALELSGVRSAWELCALAASVGLASNLAALRALATDGIQRGHMSLHARSFAAAAGASGDEVELCARRLAAGRAIDLRAAAVILGELRGAARVRVAGAR